LAVGTADLMTFSLACYWQASQPHLSSETPGLRGVLGGGFPFARRENPWERMQRIRDPRRRVEQFKRRDGVASLPVPTVAMPPQSVVDTLRNVKSKMEAGILSGMVQVCTPHSTVCT
jgi:hypothetical protein